MNLSLLIHTFNGYRHLWKGNGWHLCNHWNAPVKVYLGTDEESPDNPLHPGIVIYSGKGEWSDRLRRLLTQIDTDYILYMQEDHWMKAAPPDLHEMMEIVTQNNLLRLQLSPIVHFYKLIPSGNIHFFDPASKYLVSHQPSIWKKSFLLNCLQPAETPWVNEYKGTLRLQQTGVHRDYITKKIAIYPCDWFSHKCIKGKVVES